MIWCNAGGGEETLKVDLENTSLPQPGITNHTRGLLDRSRPKFHVKIWIECTVHVFQTLLKYIQCVLQEFTNLSIQFVSKTKFH